MIKIYTPPLVEKPQTQVQEFFMNFVKYGNTPAKEFSDFDAAQAEAIRLAKKEHKEVFILKAIKLVFLPDEVIITDLQQREPLIELSFDKSFNMNINREAEAEIELIKADLERPILELPFVYMRARILTLINSLGVKTVGEFMDEAKCWSNVLRFRNCGVRTKMAIKRVFEEQGYHLPDKEKKYTR